MFRKPRWSVTWPTRPNGVYTQLVRANDPVDAVRVAAELDWPTAPGYEVAFDYEPQVWRLLRPYRWRSRPASGPDFPDLVLGEVGFTPEPLPSRSARFETSAMRIRAWLKRRYSRPQVAALLVPSVVLSMATTFTLSRLGLPKAGVTAASFIVLFAAFGIAASVIDRRTRG